MPNDDAKADPDIAVTDEFDPANWRAISMSSATAASRSSPRPAITGHQSLLVRLPKNGAILLSAMRHTSRTTGTTGVFPSSLNGADTASMQGDLAEEQQRTGRNSLD